MQKHQVRCRRFVLGTRYFLRAYPGRARMLVPAVGEVKRLDIASSKLVRNVPWW
jgi:hypothetical protein